MFPRCQIENFKKKATLRWLLILTKNLLLCSVHNSRSRIGSSNSSACGSGRGISRCRSCIGSGDSSFFYCFNSCGSSHGCWCFFFFTAGNQGSGNDNSGQNE